MPQKNTDLLADKSYVKPDPPAPVKDLTAPQKTKVKARITNILKNGPGINRSVMEGDPPAPVSKPIPAGPMETWKVVHFTCHLGRSKDGIKTLTGAQVKAVIEEMKQSGDFAPGFGAPGPSPEEIE